MQVLSAYRAQYFWGMVPNLDTDCTIRHLRYYAILGTLTKKYDALLRCPRKNETEKV